MITVENHTGRLIEVRVRSQAQLADIVAMGAEGARLMARLSAPAVFCSDMREATQLTPAVVARLVEIYRVNNARVERTALLVQDQAAYRETFEALVREAGSGARRVFTSLPEAARWLDEKLAPNERRRLREFVAGLQSGSPVSTSARRPPRT